MGWECRQLTFERTGRETEPLVVLERLDAAFTPGTLSLITGPAGAGKSTLLHLLAGLLRPTSGEIRAGGEPISRWKPSHLERWRQQVGIVFQHLHLLPERSVLENLLVRMIPRGDTPRRTRRIVLDALCEHGLGELADAPVMSLSGGQRQRVAVARALLGAPRYLLLDEPTTFQDDDGVDAFLRRLREAALQGACVVVCAHDPRLRPEVFSDAWRLQAGRLGKRP